ncbi:hypothetical protein Tco_1022036 [Tanacetum coccineum]
MRTRSQSRNLNRQQQQAPPDFVEPFNLEEPIENPAPPVVRMDDTRTISQLLEAPTEGYEDAIIVPEITADNFELKQDHFYDEVPERPEFQQRFDETFYEAWDRFNDLLRACPHYGFLELHQLDTFYNSLNSNDQDSLNLAAGGNFLDKMPRMPKNHREQYKDMMKTLILDKQKSQAPATVKAVEEKCVTYGGAHSYQNCPATDGNVYRDNIQEYVNQPLAYQALAYQAPAPQTQGVTRTDFESYVKANDAVMQNIQTNITTLTNSNLKLKNMFSQFMKMNTASSSGTGSLPSNTVTNPKEDLKGITTRSGVAYQGPTIPTTSSSPKVVERETEVTKDQMLPTNNGSTKDVQPPVVQVQPHVPNSEPVVTLDSALMPNPKPSIPYPSRRNDERRREKANDQIEKFYEIFKDLSFEISLTDALILMPKFASTLKALIENKEKLNEMARTPLNEH